MNGSLVIISRGFKHVASFSGLVSRLVASPTQAVPAASHTQAVLTASPTQAGGNESYPLGQDWFFRGTV